MRTHGLLIAFLFFIFFTFNSLAQRLPRVVDSLLVEATKAPDSSRLRILNRVSFYFIFNDAPRADSLLSSALREAQSKKQLFSISELTNTYGILKDVSGQSDSAQFYFNRALDHSKENQHATVTVMVINNLGMYHWNKGNYEDALSYFFEALEMNKDNTTDIGDGVYLNNIGLIYQDMGLFDKALEYHEQALEVRTRHKATSEIPASLNNMAICYRNKQDYERGLEMALEAINIAKTNKLDGLYYESMSTAASLHFDQKDYTAAEAKYLEVISGREAANLNKRLNLGSISNLILIYNSLGQRAKAQQFVDKGLDYIIEFPDYTTDLGEFYRAASHAAFIKSDVQKGQQWASLATKVTDSIFSKQNANQMASLETKFKVAQSERDLAETRANLAESKLAVKRKNLLILGAFALAAILGLLGYLVYSRQRLRNKQLAKEAELNTALARIETQNKLQEQRLRISRDLHDNIGSQLTFVTSSVDNLSFGLKDSDPKITTKLKGISSFTKDTIHELRDTIWAMNKNEVHLEDLRVRISNFIDKAKAATESVAFSFDLEGTSIEKVALNSVKGMNLYRIIQEGVNNALKYAQASEIAVKIAESDKELHISITDNGQGFDTDQVERGNGLNNMNKRATDMGGNLKMDSKKGHGTTISVSCPIS